MEEEPLPVFSARAVLPTIPDGEFAAARRMRVLSGCKVEPLPEIEDPEALTF